MAVSSPLPCGIARELRGAREAAMTDINAQSDNGPHRVFPFAAKSVSDAAPFWRIIGAWEEPDALRSSPLRCFLPS
jgi:hypothetical protein